MRSSSGARRSRVSNVLRAVRFTLRRNAAMKPRRFGFPLLMLLGFAVGAGVAVAVAYGLAAQRKTFQYTTLLQLVASLGGAGTYLGHVLGAYRDKDAGIAPFGPLPQGIML